MEWPNVIWYLLQKSIIFLELKTATLSVIILVGHPNLDRMLDSRKVIMTVSVACLDGMDPIHLVK